MARSKFVWLVIYETGETQFVKAQTIWQILNCSELVEDSDSIINMTRMELADSYSFENAVNMPFQD